jgi:peptide/nickel transport system substrate-binding protein
MKSGSRRFLFVALLLMVALVVAACGGAAQPTTTDDAPTEEAAPEPTDEPAPEPTEEPEAEPTEEPAEEPTEEPAEEPTEEPAEEPTEEPAEEPTEEPAEEGADLGGTLVWADQSEPDTLDTHCTFSTWADNQFKHIYDSLVFWGPDQEFYPSLAESWEISDDFTSYTFTLRDDVTFHDGTPFNAEAVKANFDRIQEIECAVGKVAIGLLGATYESTEVVDEYTVQVNFAEPAAAFLIGASYLYIQSPTAMEEMGEDYGRQPVGTGPFVFEEWAEGDHITVVNNPDYNWAPSNAGHEGPAYLEEITWRFITEPATQLASLENGEVHFINRVPASEFEQLEANPELEAVKATTPGMPPGWLINVEKPPTDELAVRQAIGAAIDRETLRTTLFGDFFSAAHSAITSVTFGYWPGGSDYFQYDPEEAMRLLEEAGWTDTDGDGIRDKDGQPLALTMSSVDTPGWRESWEFAQAQLLEAGIDLQVNIQESGPAFEECVAGVHHICALAWGLRDPVDMQIMWGSANIGTGFAWSRLADPQVDELLAAGASETDREARALIYQELQQLILEQAAWLPMYERPIAYGANPAFQGYVILPSGSHVYLYDAYVEE